MNQPTSKELETMRDKYRRWTERGERASRIAIECREEREDAERRQRALVA